MTSRLAFIVLLFLGLAVPGAAQASDPGRFHVESVLVEGVERDAAREIVAATSLLVPGRDYAERQLREAVYRVKRLPFVLDAGYSLRPGVEPGSHQVVITIRPAEAFFASLEAAGLTSGDETGDGDRVDGSLSASAGGRWFVGSQGLLAGSVRGLDDGGVQLAQVGYTHYDLFGRGGFARLALETNLDDRSWGGSHRSSTLTLGVPLVGNQAIQADLGWSRSERDGDFSQTSTSHTGSLEWILDTTDDPLFPASGFRVTGRGTLSATAATYDDDGHSGSEDQETWGTALGARRYWTLTPRQSIGAELSADWSRWTSDGFSGRLDQAKAGIGISHALDLWRVRTAERTRDLRWESRLTFTSERTTSPNERFTLTGAALATGVTFRSAWGLSRLTFTYVDTLEEDVQLRGGR